MLSGVGLSNLQFVNMNNSRNLFIVGSALFVGLAVPTWIEKNQGKNPINTGNFSFREKRHHFH